MVTGNQKERDSTTEEKKERERERERETRLVVWQMLCPVG